jgi:hypothetical protein
MCICEIKPSVIVAAPSCSASSPVSWFNLAASAYTIVINEYVSVREKYSGLRIPETFRVSPNCAYSYDRSSPSMSQSRTMSFVTFQALVPLVFSLLLPAPVIGSPVDSVAEKNFNRTYNSPTTVGDAQQPFLCDNWQAGLTKRAICAAGTSQCTVYDGCCPSDGTCCHDNTIPFLPTNC